MTWVSAARILLGMALVVSLAACSRSSGKPQDISGIHAEGSAPYEGAVAFELAPVDNGSGPRQWLGSYASAGKTAKFRIELGPGHSGDADDKALHVSFGKGRLLSEPGSDASV